MKSPSYQDILKRIEQLPLQAQVELMETMWQTIRDRQAISQSNSEEELVPLFGLSEEDLRVLAAALVAPESQQTIWRLLRKQQRHPLSAQDEAHLNELLAEADQLALLKARAMYTLALQQGQLSNRAAA
ncbi:MAG: hypothetical protein DCC55_31830 [Chloroflexi bacterium]|nr:MAG: hypothetical protein DCC55_31830 [Chloroflexota bacterium]